MGRKGSSASEQSIAEDEEEITIEEQVEKDIKKITNLAEKVQLIAINKYLIEKRQIDKKLQGEINKIESNDRKSYDEYLVQIHNIISGKVDLTDADFEGLEDLLTDQENGAKQNYYPKKQLEEYWLKILISSEEAGEILQPADEEILKHLMNVTATKTEDGTNLTVVFHFSENQWFTNATIKKQFQLEGDTIQRSFGDAIEWKEGKNVTIEVVKKRNKKKKTTTTKTVKKQSLFNIFRDIDLSSDNQNQEGVQEEEEEKEIKDLEKQYQICNALYESLIPRSLQNYLGLVSSFGDLDGMDGLEQIQEEDDDEEQKPKKIKKEKRKCSHNHSHSSKE